MLAGADNVVYSTSVDGIKERLAASSECKTEEKAAENPSKALQDVWRKRKEKLAMPHASKEAQVRGVRNQTG